MSENKEFIVNEMEETTAMPTAVPENPTVGYVLGQIEKIMSDTDYLHRVITELGNTQSGGPGDYGASERAQALGHVVACRETTNQRLIDFYQKLYEDLKPRPDSVAGSREGVAAQMMSILRDPGADKQSREYASDILRKYMQMI